MRRGDFAATYYLTGDEDVLKDELVALLLEQTVDPAMRDFNFDVRSAADLDGERLHALIETPPMLAERRVVVIRNAEQWRKNAPVWTVLYRYLENPSPTTTLVILHGAGQRPNPKLAAASTHVMIDRLTPERVARWIHRRADASSLEIDPAAATHLIETVGLSLTDLGTELEKLAAATPAGSRLGADDVARLVGVRRGETATDWVAAVLQRDLSRAVDLLPIVLAAPGTSGVRLLNTLGTALVGTQLARAHLDHGMSPERAESAVHQVLRRARLGWVGDWRVEARRWTDAAAAWSRAELSRAIDAAAAADRSLKSTTISDEAGTLTDLLLQSLPQRVAA